MAKFEIMTMRKGEITTIDSFINNFNTIGANMKALCVSAFNFLTSEDKELVKSFRCRVIDELNMSKSSLSYMKTAGRLYMMHDIFSEFPYTNVVFFDKAIEKFIERNPDVSEIKHDDEFLSRDEVIAEGVIVELARLHSSHVGELEECKDSLLELSQKELKHLIEIYCKDEETTEDTEETSEETEETTEDDVEEIDDEVIEEVNDHIVTFYDEEIDSIINLIDAILESPKPSKQAMIDALTDIRGILNK